jgi:hypothetical protein
LGLTAAGAADKILRLGSASEVLSAGSETMLPEVGLPVAGVDAAQG